MNKKRSREYHNQLKSVDLIAIKGIKICEVPDQKPGVLFLWNSVLIPVYRIVDTAVGFLKIGSVLLTSTERVASNQHSQTVARLHIN